MIEMVMGLYWCFKVRTDTEKFTNISYSGGLYRLLFVFNTFINYKPVRDLRTGMVRNFHVVLPQHQVFVRDVS